MDSPEFSLVPLVEKLNSRSTLGVIETNAILALPVHFRKFQPGVVLIREGEVSKYCSLILTGFACRSKGNGGKSRQILSVHLRGDLVDLHNNILDEADYDVQSLTRVVSAHISRQAIFELSELYPAIRRALWIDTLAEMSMSREWLLNVGRRSGIDRVAHLLCELTLRQQSAGTCTGPEYDWPMTQDQFGDATGLTGVHINRMLKILREEKLISCSKGRVTIYDWHKLKERAHFTQEYLHNLY